MTHLLRKGERFYYNRRVPEHVRPFDNRNFIRIALDTDSRTVAKQKAYVFNEQIEAYWAELIRKDTPHDVTSFRQAITIAKHLGFGYQPLSVVAKLPLLDLARRTQAAANGTSEQVAAVLGGYAEPELTLAHSLERFWGYTKERIVNKSEDQIRKWKNPRKKAINNLIEVIGDKPLQQITRDDIIKFKDWWLARLKANDMSTETANKDFIHAKHIIETVAENLRLDIDTKYLFKKIVLKDRFSTQRLPFTTEQIIAILNSPKLHRLNLEARLFLHIAADTGARPSEIVGLLPEDIHLTDDIPYISIKDRPKRPLKTPHSERDIPLVGYAFEAFKQIPNGFVTYLNKTDNLCNCVNKFLRENDLLPSKQHSIYSFRHSFQDRLTSVNAPERIQCELMGHKFHREKYGLGGTLEDKQSYLQEMAVRKTITVVNTLDK